MRQLTKKYQKIWDEIHKEMWNELVELIKQYDADSKKDVENIIDLHKSKSNKVLCKFLERVLPEAHYSGRDWEANKGRVMPKLDHLDSSDYLKSVIQTGKP